MSEIVRTDLFLERVLIPLVVYIHTIQYIKDCLSCFIYLIGTSSISHTFPLFEYSVHELEAVNMISAVSGAWTVW